MLTRDFHAGMGRAVAERTVLRKVPKNKNLTTIDVCINDPVHDDMKNYAQIMGLEFNVHEPDMLFPMEWVWETWGDVADRVALGNTLLVEGCDDYDNFNKHLRAATILMSGRHLQHGDRSQPTRNLEVFSNCSTAPASFLLFYLLLNGSGVGRSYDDDLMLVNWDHSPTVRCVLASSHPDFDYVQHESVRDAEHKYGHGETVHWFKVPDSREGWAQAVELYETMTFQKAFRDHLLILDFSDVRGKGAAIGGMQGRPSSGPAPLMAGIHRIGTLKGAGIPLWMQAMYVDQYLAEPVLVGGARRAARMAVKYWKDRTVIDFINVKRPIEYKGMSYNEVADYRADVAFPPLAFLWSSNNSVGVDAEFWERLSYGPEHKFYNAEATRHARAVFEAATGASYGDGTGEPGFINLDQLVQNDKGSENILDGSFVGSKRYQVMDETRIFLSGIAKRDASKKYKMIVNPCGEITIVQRGGYCVIADNVPYHAETLHEGQDACMTSARALIRVNQMDSLYNAEVKRTNRIGVGLTGVHEFAWKFFKVGFLDIVKPDWIEYIRQMKKLDHSLDYLDVADKLRKHGNKGVRAAAFWETLGSFSRNTVRSAYDYSDKIGVNRPHTVMTIKPAGTTSKLFGLTEGWHLSPYAHYQRYVQFRDDDPQVDQYEANGYEVRTLETYRGHRIVGFPTEPIIAGLGMGDNLVLAGDATPDDQYTWIKLGEYFWIEGGTVEEMAAGLVPRMGEERYGNQISYTLKYKPEVTSLEDFRTTIRENQSKVRCASVMPQADTSAYEYLPETAITKAEFENLVAAIKIDLEEDFDAETMQCAGGACPVDIKP
jgi:hypothetical protein